MKMNQDPIADISLSFEKRNFVRTFDLGTSD